MIVMKFGGTSVGTAEAIRNAAEIIQSRSNQNPIVIVSAMGKVTDILVDITKASLAKNKEQIKQLLNGFETIHHEVFYGLDLKNKNELLKLLKNSISQINSICEQILSEGDDLKNRSDSILSFGELLSVHILSSNLCESGLKSCTLDSRKLLVTDAQFSCANPLLEESEVKIRNSIPKLIRTQTIPVIQGFVGADILGRTTTLGRGGSDFTATLIGSMLNVNKIEVWSDVDGVLTADPHIVPEAKRIRSMNFYEAAELAYFGAKVLHPSTLLPAIVRNIPVVVLNSKRPEKSGTTISGAQSNDNNNHCIIKSIAYKENISIITVRSTRMLMAFGFMASIFKIFNRYETSIDLVSTSEISVSITTDKKDNLEKIVTDLEKIALVDVEHDKAIVCLVGEQMKQTTGMPARIFSLLEDVHIHLISQGSSEINISFVIDNADINKIINRLHANFFKDLMNEELFEVFAEVAD